ncbi:MAG: HEPN domain-containing protein [Nanoarchaeota archaeon]
MNINECIKKGWLRKDTINQNAIIQPSEELSKSYINKSKNSLESAKILPDNLKLEESVSLAYYSMYHILTALLYKNGIKCENHPASIILLKELFKLDNSKMRFVKKERIDKQDYVDFKLTEKDVKDLIKITEEFNASLYYFIESITFEEIKEYRNELKNILQTNVDQDKWRQKCKRIK